MINLWKMGVTLSHLQKAVFMSHSSCANPWQQRRKMTDKGMVTTQKKSASTLCLGLIKMEACLLADHLTSLRVLGQHSFFN